MLDNSAQTQKSYNWKNNARKHGASNTEKTLSNFVSLLFFDFHYKVRTLINAL